MSGKCGSCLGDVDDDGVTDSPCAWNSPSECEECGYCYCDGSC